MFLAILVHPCASNVAKREAAQPFDSNFENVVQFAGIRFLLFVFVRPIKWIGRFQSHTFLNSCACAQRSKNVDTIQLEIWQKIRRENEGLVW